jgi:hypothetical protein
MSTFGFGPDMIDFRIVMVAPASENLLEGDVWSGRAARRPPPAAFDHRDAWVLTLPAAMMLSGSLYWLFSHLF